MRCAHVGDLQQLPECEMEQRCPHSYHCPICEYDWPCTVKDCHANVEEHPGIFNDKLRDELESILEDEE